MIKKAILALLFTVILIIVSTTVFAANPSINISGDATAKPAETKTITISISAEEDYGSLSGIIKGENGITIKSLTAKNNWTAGPFNEQTGNFIFQNNSGAKSGAIFEVTYETGNAEGTGKITISDMKVVLISDYSTKELGNTEKAIQIKKAEVDPPATEKKLDSIAISGTPTKSYVEGEKFTSKGIKVTATYTDKTTKDVTSAIAWAPSGELKTTDKEITIMYTENGITKTNTLSIVVSAKKDPDEKDPDEKDPDEKDPEKKPGDGTEADRDLSKAGLEKTILSILIGALGVSSIAGYAIYKKN